ncbi:S-methyl-5'-thioinosine phosphorylase [Carboxydochorda subterranea]|uniref:Purine nucleoside phosphorylase n=1 Tax=Carboxydichorda subterranea TaxID=3109565 RepID=A0ABZ1BUK2_9FIRM|nr:S-methyl-5'-thioinosine phosphorylase [Limnochorda sp. L945t]WRP16328.1 S-methyl-5'-thioinosine phosphorylase [Limnochorda sp. L945t]
MRARLAVVGGTGFDDPGLLGAPVAAERVVTRFGQVALSYYHVGGDPGAVVAFLPRHGAAHGVPPHRIDYRANFAALARAGVERIVATAAVGSLRATLAPGTLLIPDQVLDFTRSRPGTFYDEAVVHTDFTEPYCPQMREALLRAAGRQGLSVEPAGTYAVLEGPRYETAAEVRTLALLGGDVVGMTGMPEAILAREAGMCMAVVAVVTNLGAGIAQRELSHAEVGDVMARRRADVVRLMLEALTSLPEARACPCSRIRADGRPPVW